jgi:uncharacterized protein YegL
MSKFVVDVTKGTDLSKETGIDDFLFAETVSTPIIGFVLDGSGSMISCRYETIDGFNKYIKETGIALPMETEFILGKFGTSDNPQKVISDSVALATVSPLNSATYNPCSMTPLYDTVLAVIEKVQLRKTADPSFKPVVVIQTDGEDTQSFNTLATVFKTVGQKQKEGWTFIVLGADTDAEALARDFGIPIENALEYGKAKSISAFNLLISATVKATEALTNKTPIFSIEDKRKLK